MGSTRCLPAGLVRDLHATLARLRTARLVDDQFEIVRATRRFDWLCDQLPRPQDAEVAAENV